jgi:hypothetical protein
MTTVSQMNLSTTMQPKSSSVAIHFLISYFRLFFLLCIEFQSDCRRIMTAVGPLQSLSLLIGYFHSLSFLSVVFYLLLLDRDY